MGWTPAAKSVTALEETYNNAKATTLLALFSTVPGYWVTVLTVDRIGRKPIQLLGFFMMSVLLLVIGADFYQLRLHKYIFITLYAGTFFFSNFGPNATTFIVPSELFPARLRASCHGIAAACGKAGAIVGSFGFLYASQDETHGLKPGTGYNAGIGYGKSFILLGVCAVVGFVVTVVCIPETKGKSLEHLSGENDDEAAAAAAAAAAHVPVH